MSICKKEMIFWCPALTNHMGYFLNAISILNGKNILINTIYNDHPDRILQGWSTSKFDNINHAVLRGKFSFFKMVIKAFNLRNETHIFISPYEKFSLLIILFFISYISKNIYLISEPYSNVKYEYLKSQNNFLLSKFKATFRPLLYKFYSLILKRQINGIFCISELSYIQYLQVGYSKDKLIPFGYFVPKYSESDLNKNSHLAPKLYTSTISTQSLFPISNLRLLYIGSLLPIKGLDILIQAVYKSRSNGVLCTLDIYGHGNSSTLDIDNLSIFYKGVIPFGSSQKIMSDYDLLVVPSRYDGWGVVVNEAILSNTLVACSNAVGARVLLNKTSPNLIFNEDSIDNLYSMIDFLYNNSMLIPYYRSRQLTIQDQITPSVAANYFINKINRFHTDIIPAWDFRV